MEEIFKLTCLNKDGSVRHPEVSAERIRVAGRSAFIFRDDDEDMNGNKFERWNVSDCETGMIIAICFDRETAILKAEEKLKVNPNGIEVGRNKCIEHKVKLPVNEIN